jgi:acyl-CoA thioester hydrolase
MEEKNYLFNLDFVVRDYELDLQGIVNNSVYQNYMEHCRHEFIKSRGVDFARLHHDEGIDPVVVRIEIDYKRPLTSGDRFSVKLNIGFEGRMKMIFWQDIYREDGTLMTQGKITAAILKNFRPIPVPEAMAKALS